MSITIMIWLIVFSFPGEVCVFDIDAYIDQFDRTPDADIIGYVEKDDIFGLTETAEEVRINDEIGQRTIVRVDCNNW